LREYKDIYGNLNVSLRENKSLAQFCAAIRTKMKKGKLAEGRKAALDALNFPWASTKESGHDSNQEEQLDFACIV